MKARASALFLLISAVLLAAQAVVALRADDVRFHNRLLAEPAQPVGGHSLNALEKLAEEGVVLTYELPRAASLEALNNSHSITVTGTNAEYAGVMGYPLLHGGFLTETAYGEKLRQVVLNETAAFRIFGTVSAAGNILKMDGETWSVVGVLRDGDKEDARAYVPSSIAGGSPEAFWALTDENHPQAFVLSRLKGIGVQGEQYRIADLSRIGAAFRERLTVSLLAGGAGILLVMVAGWARSALAEYRSYRRRTGFAAATESGGCGKGHVPRIAGLLLLTAAGCAALLLLSRHILALSLGRYDLLKDLEALSGRWFAEKVRALQRWNRLSLLLFFTTILSHICLIFTLFSGRKSWYTMVTRQSEKVAGAQKNTTATD